MVGMIVTHCAEMGIMAAQVIVRAQWIPSLSVVGMVAWIMVGTWKRGE